MTIDELKVIWHDDNTDEYLKFDRVQHKLSSRPDIHVMIRLNELFPGDSDMVTCAAHDVFFLDVDGQKFAEVATPELIIEMSRCGVHWDTDYDCLAMFT